MSQLAFFDKVAPLRAAARVPRWYQEHGHEQILASLQANRSCLTVMATGTGKTFLLSLLAMAWDGALTQGNNRVLALAHTDELVRQLAESLEVTTGECVGIEKADERSDGQRLVVGSFQSMNQSRLERIGKDRFGLVIPDEAHHGLAPTFRRAIDFFDAKVAGFTATPDRGDEKALGSLFDDVAFVYDILDAINDGFLVPVEAHQVTLEEIDLSDVGTTAGDFSAGQLDEAMQKSVEGVSQKLLELAGSRQGLVFWPGVRSAEAAAARLNALKPGCAEWVAGETDKQERKEIIRRFRRGDIQFLNNCQLLTEGFDAPESSLVAVARPTKSRSLYAQMLGRGLRPAPGTIDDYPGKEQAAERRAAIAASRKGNALILDFVGNAGKHTLVTPVDVLGGDYSEEEVKEAKIRVARDGQDVREALAAARSAIQAAAAAKLGRVKASVQKYDPFRLLNIDQTEAERYTRRFGFVSPTPNQLAALAKFGLGEEDGIAQLSKREASKMIDQLISRSRNDMASYKQARVLAKWGLTDPNMSFKRAGAALNYIAQNRWKKGSVDPRQLHSLAYGRDPGEDG